VGAKNGDGSYGETAEPTMVFVDGKRSCRQLSFVPFAPEEIEVIKTAADPQCGYLQPTQTKLESEVT
jgi:hypothetical protein